MKKILTLICTLLCANVLMAQTTFTIDSLHYEVTSTNPAEVELYSSNLSIVIADIPETVSYEGTTYSVTAIGEAAFGGIFARTSLISVTIPNSVTSIGEQAFYGCSSLTSVSIPNSVTSISIGEAAFYDCSSLTSANIGNGVTSIGNYAFSGCSSLTSVDIPNSVTSIGTGAFFGCSSLTTLNYNAINCPDFGSSLFSEATLTTINIGDSVQIIPEIFAMNQINLTSVTIGNNVTSIGQQAFYGCSSLTSITIPNNVTSIGEQAFRGCSNLSSVTLPENATISTYAFYECGSTDAMFSIDNVIYSLYYDENIGNYTFERVYNVTFTIGDNVYKPSSAMVYYHTSGLGGNVTLASALTYNGVVYPVNLIDYTAFQNCSNLTSITIPNSIFFIGNQAFENCSSLTSVTIGNGVAYIGSSAFTGCNFLQNVTCLATTPPTLPDNTVFPYPNIATLTVPCGSLEAYSAPTSFWNMFFNGRIEEDCSGIEQAETESISFYPNPTKSEITFSQAIEKIEVIDLTGKTIFTFSNAKTINIESLPAGAYYLRLTNAEKTSLQKVIKQ